MSNIAITGIGIVSAIGVGTEAVLDSLRRKATGIGPMRYLQTAHNDLPVGEVHLSDKQLKQMLRIPASLEVSRTALLGMVAILQAVEETGLLELRATSTRINLVSGTTVAGMDVTERHFADIENDPHPTYILKHDCGGSTRVMVNYFDSLFRDVATVSTACSSAANALTMAANMLTLGDADVVVAGGTESLSRFHLNGFNSLMILDHEQCRPFDETRAGLNLGEGAAYLVLETKKHAKARGAKIYGYLSGYGNACDAFHQTASSDTGEGAYRAMTDAISMAGISPADIQYVNAHGTGTPNNDISESVALKRVFGDRMPLVSSTKGFTGHATSASGSIEAAICLLAMNNGFVPANLGWKTAMTGGIVPTMGVEKIKLKHVLCNSFGFGGNDTSIVFSACSSRKPLFKLPIDPEKVTIVAREEITSEDELDEIRRYVKPLEARRMGKLMKSSLLASLKVLEKVGIETPDAIVVGTSYGCWENSERLLKQMIADGEQTMKPTYFMQSTHNTIASNIAIKTHCHGYNATYSQGEESYDWVLHDAYLLLISGKCKNVLIGLHDESTPLLNEALQRVGQPPQPLVHSVAMVMKCCE